MIASFYFVEALLSEMANRDTLDDMFECVIEKCK